MSRKRAEGVGVVDHSVIQRKLVVGIAGKQLAVGGGVADVLLRVAAVDVVLLAGDPVDLEVALVAVGVGVGHIDLVLRVPGCC